MQDFELYRRTTAGRKYPAPARPLSFAFFSSISPVVGA
jgi:hypothetical protein